MDEIMSSFNEENIQDANWFDMFSLLTKLSKSIRNNKDNSNKDIIEKNLIETIIYVLYFAKQNNINMKQSWERWNIKVNYKHYF